MTCWHLILIACFTAMNPRVIEKDVVSVSVNETVVAPGKKSLVIIRVKVSTGYHIQADRVTNKSLIPVSLEANSNRFFSIKKGLFPPYKLFRLEGTTESLNVFDSVFIIRLPVKAIRTIQEGRYIVKARLSYQACNAKTCLFPRRLDFDIPIIVKN